MVKMLTEGRVFIELYLCSRLHVLPVYHDVVVPETIQIHLSQCFIWIVCKPVRPRLLVERPYYVQQLVDDDEVDAAGGAKVDGQVPAGPKREINAADSFPRCIF